MNGNVPATVGVPAIKPFVGFKNYATILSDEKFLEFRSKLYLPAIYAHLISLAQTERLISLHEDAHPAAAGDAAPAKAPAKKATAKQ